MTKYRSERASRDACPHRPSLLPITSTVRRRPAYRAAAPFFRTTPVRIHKSITLERVSESVERSHTTLDNPGFCILCGAEGEGVEPDARKYQCDACGAPGVYGAEELLLIMIA